MKKELEYILLLCFVQFSQCLHNSSTIRASCIQRFYLSGGKRGKFRKEQEVVKLDAAKGKVSERVFEDMYDVKKRPRERRITL